MLSAHFCFFKLLYESSPNPFTFKYKAIFFFSTGFKPKHKNSSFTYTNSAVEHFEKAGLCLVAAWGPARATLLRSSYKLSVDQLWVTAAPGVFVFATWDNTVSFTANSHNYREMVVANAKGILWAFGSLLGEISHVRSLRKPSRRQSESSASRQDLQSKGSD